MSVYTGGIIKGQNNKKPANKRLRTPRGPGMTGCCFHPASIRRKFAPVSHCVWKRENSCKLVWRLATMDGGRPRYRAKRKGFPLATFRKFWRVTANSDLKQKSTTTHHRL